MRNLKVSKPKIVLHLFFLLAIFYYCIEEITAKTILNPLKNNAPMAVIAADILSGDAPLRVNFSGNKSFDDNSNVTYYWEFPSNSSSVENPTYTFNQIGVYDITLMVTDDANQTSTAKVTITVTHGNGDNTGGGACKTNGGKANETGLKTWCWYNITIPTYTNSKGVSFSNNQLHIDSECNENAISIVGDRLHFFVDPLAPPVEAWCTGQSYNKRAEIYTNPWNVQHSPGTEEWFGFNYRFGDEYIPDVENPWLFFQVHNGVVGTSPHFEILLSEENIYGVSNGGEIVVKNAAFINPANGGWNDFEPTGITPIAGEELDIVVHAVWGDESNGLLQVWINGQSVYDKKVRTVYKDFPWGGNAKWGIYKWSWSSLSKIQSSTAQGITSLETSIGELKIITRQPSDPEYLDNSYSLVASD